VRLQGLGKLITFIYLFGSGTRDLVAQCLNDYTTAQLKKKCIYSLAYFGVPVYLENLSLVIPPHSRDSGVGKATDYGLDNRKFGVLEPVKSRIFSSP
jgi:hypothetical protein